MQMAGKVECNQMVKWDENAWSSQVQFPGGLPSVECDRACRLCVTGIRSFRAGGITWIEHFPGRELARPRLERSGE